MFQRLTPMVKNLLIITVAAYLITSLLGINLALYPFGTGYFGAWQLFTYMFSHGGIMHILFNMLGLIFMGPLLEQFWGAKKFLIFYLVVGIGAGVFNNIAQYSIVEFQTARINGLVNEYISDPNPDNFDIYIRNNAPHYHNQVEAFIKKFNSNENDRGTKDQSISYVKEISSFKLNELLNTMHPVVGASGAIIGLMMAIGLLFPNTQFMLLFPPIPIKAKTMVAISMTMVIFLIIMNYYIDFGHGERSGFLYGIYSFFGGGGVAHFAHLGGMIFAFIMIKLWSKERNNFY